MTHMKSNGQWVNNAFTEVNDKVNDVVAEKLLEVEDGTDVDPIINDAFLQVMGGKSSYILGQGSGIKSTSKISKNKIQEQLQAQAEEERRKRESVESKLMKVETQLEDERKSREELKTQLEDERKSREELKTQLEDERKSREEMEARLVQDQKMFRESIMALVTPMCRIPRMGMHNSTL